MRTSTAAFVTIIGLFLLGTLLVSCTDPGGTPASNVPGSSTPGTPGRGVGERPGETPRPETDRIKVLVTTSVIADFVRQVGQDRVVVRNIVPSGADPHTFQPTPRDVREISESGIVIMNGIGLEGALEKIVRNSIKPSSRLVVVAEGLPVIEEDHDESAGHSADEDEHAGGNPHLWLDVALATRYVQHIQAELAATDPAGAAVYELNASAYLAQLAELDRWIEEQVQSIPQESRKLVTLHDAFPYYAKRYGLDLVGVVVRNPESEPSAREVAELVQTIRREGVRTVFAETQLNPRLMEIVAREAGAKVAFLYSDSVDDKVTTYVAMMRHNTEQVVNGLR